TVVVCVDPGSARLEQAGDALVDVGHRRFGEESASNARLIRDDDDAISGRVERANRVNAPRIEGRPVHAIEISDLFDQRSVPVEKDGGSWRVHHVARAASKTRPAGTPRMHS